MILKPLLTFLAGILKGSRTGRKVPPFSDQEWTSLCTNAGCQSWLSDKQKEALRTMCADFLSVKQIVGYGTCRQDLRGPRRPTILWTLAIQCCLPVLGLGLESYRTWHSIILVPGSRLMRESRDEGNGLVTEYEEDTAGEVLPWGPVVISMEDMFAARRGYNVVIHEMAHKLDSGNGEMDACPALPEELVMPWAEAWKDAWGDFEARLSRPSARRKLPLDEYAATDPQEFFAVVLEEFFGRPWHILRVYPGLYRLLASWLGLDPARSMNLP